MWARINGGSWSFYSVEADGREELLFVCQSQQEIAMMLDWYRCVKPMDRTRTIIVRSDANRSILHRISICGFIEADYR
jgi:hypothetical protein